MKPHENQIEQVKSMLEAAFAFIEKVWGNHQEMVLFLTELTVGADSLDFIQQWGCDAYFRYNQELLAYDQEQRLTDEVERLLDV